jgi:hypothetical protein
MIPRRTAQSVLQLRFRTFIVRSGRMASLQQFRRWQLRLLAALSGHFKMSAACSLPGANATPWRGITTAACHRPIRSGCHPQKRCSSLPESAGRKLGSRVAAIAARPKLAESLPHLRFTAAHSAARYAASATMSSSVIAFIRSDMPGLLPRAPVRKSSIVLSR